MNRIFKRIVPVVMAIAILICIGWYLFVYDRTFTRDMMLNMARVCDTEGYPTLASWFYDRAYVYSGNDESVAIELANQYKADGNYTKAEYSLSNAIAQEPSVDLYVALCKTYVEQDKLLDAVNLLDNIGDAAIKSQLDFLRPAAPTATPEAGFYSQYVPVTLLCDSGTMYYNTMGEYPSTEDAPYTEPITLPGGETTIYAITVAESGLVSPVTKLGYTVGGVIEPVTLADPAMDAAIRQLLQMEPDDTLYTNDLWEITEFVVPTEAASLDDLTRLPYLKKLAIENQSIPSLSCLSSMAQLEELTMIGCKFPTEDQSILAALPNLKRLTMSSCGLSTIADLEGAPGLVYLDLSNNTIRNLAALSAMTTLEEINLQHNAVMELSALSGLSNLKKLDVSYNSISAMDPLGSCSKLQHLDLGHNTISAIASVDVLPELSYLSLNNNSITDASLLAKATNLVELHLAYNELKNITMLSALMKLEVLDFSHNTVYEVPIWGDESPLRVLDGSYNEISSIDTLWNLDKLTYIYMDYNKLTALSNLASMPNLVQINAYGNPLTDLTGLEAKNIIVNYDPTLG